VKHPTRGARGLSGWTITQRELEDYFESIARAWQLRAHLWYWFRPPDVVRFCIRFDPPDATFDAPAAILVPSEHFFMLLRVGGVIRHMRVIDQFGRNGIPVFEGTGEIMGPMTEREAMEFIAWKDVPRGVNRWEIAPHSAIAPQSMETVKS